MNKFAAVAAVVLLALVGAYTGEAHDRSAGAVITARIQSVRADEGRIISLKQLRDRHGDVIGWANTVCVPLGNRSAQCVGTFILPKGKINVAGTRHSQSFFVFAIVGGTGVYRAAGGELVAREYRPRQQRLVFNLVLR